MPMVGRFVPHLAALGGVSDRDSYTAPIWSTHCKNGGMHVVGSKLRVGLLRSVLVALLIGSAYALIAGDGLAPLAGILGFVVWAALDTELDRRRGGWRSALIVKVVMVWLLAAFVAIMAEPLAFRIIGWGALFLAAWAGSAWSWRRSHPVTQS
jgi:hypothetical protein